MRILACPNCGSREIFMGTMDSGVIIGVTSTKSVCKNCGFQGSPLIFESEDEYKEFIKHLKYPLTQEKTKQESKKQSEKVNVNQKKNENENQLDFSDESDVKEKKWGVEILIAVVMAVTIGLWSYLSFVGTMGSVYATVYLVGYILSLFLIILFVIVFIRYLFKSIH